MIVSPTEDEMEFIRFMVSEIVVHEITQVILRDLVKEQSDE